jgi:hypothetical protein
MSQRLIRAVLAIEFLLALEVSLTFWSEVGGQYDLDLMFWPWKFGLILAAAGLTVGLTAELLRAAPRRFSRRAGLYVAGLILVMITAGAVTYSTWLNEPQDDDGGDDPASLHATQLYLSPQSGLKSPATRSEDDFPSPASPANSFQLSNASRTLDSRF